MNEVEAKSEDILQTAYEMNASDIHFVPRKGDILIELRVNHHLFELDLLPTDFAERMISHFKFRAGMDIGDRRRPQDGALNTLIHNEPVNLRLSTLPTKYNESLVIRLLPQAMDTQVSDLSIFSESTAQLMRFLNVEHGLLLFSGPTGSGKSSTMYALLTAAKRRFNARIVTLEDPVEKQTENFLQMEVNEKANLTYDTGFKAILRHDPDIIMVGEIRDSETAKIAIRASLTGHLVFSTIHASDSVRTLQRLMELGISRFDLKETLVGVVAQRLINIQCPRCGSFCKKDCPHFKTFKKRQTAIFEILTGLPLRDLLKTSEIKTMRPYKRLEDYYRQAASLGYLPQDNALNYGEHKDVFP
ncbi:competence protein ComGA [Pullulanibacillus pueri]|uniref:Competence protein ComG n=1 Tax=Pullulanibacillus pueri TaxID=1437324 RepID=A0A8J3EL59_9BACL|nr:competence type IV pilus ATPase ComGA [Pullulanibacillus pueri]MBM7681550.1 competence protein ComGA [Pullulanibacillus pueri]GGH79710.1 competence protein ComG [Pullulanibacillus pueri]